MVTGKEFAQQWESFKKSTAKEVQTDEDISAWSVRMKMRFLNEQKDSLLSLLEQDYLTSKMKILMLYDNKRKDLEFKLQQMKQSTLNLNNNNDNSGHWCEDCENRLAANSKEEISMIPSWWD